MVHHSLSMLLNSLGYEMLDTSSEYSGPPRRPSFIDALIGPGFELSIRILSAYQILVSTHCHPPWQCMLQSVSESQVSECGDRLTQQIDDTARIAPLVVVPGDKLHKIVVQRDTCLSVEDGGVGVAIEVARNDLVFCVGQNAFWQSVSRSWVMGDGYAYPCIRLPKRL